MDTNTDNQPDHCGFCGKSRFKAKDNGFKTNCSLCGQNYKIHQTCASYIIQETQIAEFTGGLQCVIDLESFNKTTNVTLWCLKCRKPCFFCNKIHKNQTCKKILCSICKSKWCRVLPEKKKITAKSPPCQQQLDNHKTALCQLCSNKDSNNVKKNAVTEKPNQSTDPKEIIESGSKDPSATLDTNADTGKISRFQYSKKSKPLHYLWKLPKEMHEQISDMIQKVLGFGVVTDGLVSSFAMSMDSARRFFDSRIMFFHSNGTKSRDIFQPFLLPSCYKDTISLPKPPTAKDISIPPLPYDNLTPLYKQGLLTDSTISFILKALNQSAVSDINNHISIPPILFGDPMDQLYPSGNNATGLQVHKQFFK